jgi:hypothetical protein
MVNHIKFWFKTKPMNTEIPTTNIARVSQDQNKLNIIYIDLKEGDKSSEGDGSRKTYLCESTDQAIEIVGKLSLILALNAEDRA